MRASKMTVLVWLAGLVLAAFAAIACTREDYEPDPKPQTLVPCDPSAAEDDPLACPPDAGVDAAPPDGIAVQPEQPSPGASR